MDAASCGRFKLTFKFKLFTVGSSVPDPYQFFCFFCLTVLVQLGIYLSVLVQLGIYLSGFFHTYPLYSFYSVWRASRGQVSREGEVFL